MLKNMRGFVAVELAVVIGFFAVVVSVVIFYLNPIEQAKQKHDQRLKYDSQKVLDALGSFYNSRGRMPWAQALGTQALSPALRWKPLRAVEVGICQDELCQSSGELITSGFLSQDFKAQDGILVGKANGPQNPTWACFVPTSGKVRKDTGQLYRISLDKPIPASGTPNTCPSNLTWSDEDVCHLCTAR